jgi:putative acetyltransferase
VGIDEIEIAEMAMGDYEEVAALWERTEGVGLDQDSDCAEKVRLYLERNPGLSFVARLDGKLVGAVLCGHDGRRGYLHHLAVEENCRRAGIGSALVDRCLGGLGAAGIAKCNIFLFGDNELGSRFWSATGWNARRDLVFMQKWTGQEREPKSARSC